MLNTNQPERVTVELQKSVTEYVKAEKIKLKNEKREVTESCEKIMELATKYCDSTFSDKTILEQVTQAASKLDEVFSSLLKYQKPYDELQDEIEDKNRELRECQCTLRATRQRLMDLRREKQTSDDKVDKWIKELLQDLKQKDGQIEEMRQQHEEQISLINKRHNEQMDIMKRNHQEEMANYKNLAHEVKGVLENFTNAKRESKGKTKKFQHKVSPDVHVSESIEVDDRPMLTTRPLPPIKTHKGILKIFIFIRNVNYFTVLYGNVLSSLLFIAQFSRWRI